MASKVVSGLQRYWYTEWL